MKSGSAAWHLKPLEVFFGSKRLTEISDDDVTAYREKRGAETVIRHGERSVKPVSQNYDQ
jgi:hypothetical protein